MTQVLFRFLRSIVLGSSLAVAAAAAAYDFGSWPAGTSPQEIGRRVAANFIPRPHMPIGKTKVIHYAEVCTWYGALTFANLTKDEALRQQLVERFEPLFREEKHLIPTPDHVDYTVFGAVPLELYLQTKELRYLDRTRIVGDFHGQAPVLWCASAFLRQTP